MTNIVRVEFIPDQIRGKPTLNKTKTPSILFNFLSNIKLLGSLTTNTVRVEFIPDQICGQPTLWARSKPLEKFIYLFIKSLSY